MEPLLDVVGRSGLQLPLTQMTWPGGDKAGLFYIVHTGLLNTRIQMTMLQHDSAVKHL